MFDDIPSLIALLLRFGHIVFGTLFLGGLYFVNLVNIPFQAELDPQLRARITPGLMLRVGYWVRAGGLFVVIFGWLLFGYKYGHQKLLFDGDGGISNRAIWILFGGFLGTAMWWNGTFLVWPRQKKLLAGMLAGQMPADAPQLIAASMKLARINLFASGPLLFAMIVPNTYPGWSPLGILLVIVVGIGFWQGPLKRSWKIKTTLP